MDAKILIQEFLAEQREQEAKKALQREQSSLNEVGFLARRPMKPKEVIRYAREFGFAVANGGRHGTHLVAPNGAECPLPVHGGGRTLANGTQRSIVDFIQQNGTVR